MFQIVDAVLHIVQDEGATEVVVALWALVWFVMQVACTTYEETQGSTIVQELHGILEGLFMALHKGHLGFVQTVLSRPAIRSARERVRGVVDELDSSEGNGFKIIVNLPWGACKQI